MPRSKRPLLSDCPYHLTVRTNDRKAFPVPMEIVWDVVVGELEHTTTKYGVVLLGAVAMSNHFHLIAETPEANVSQWMQQLLSRVSRRMRRPGEESHHLLGKRFHSSVIGTALYFAHAYRYVLRNPVAAGLSPDVQSYPYSSVQWERGHVAPSMFDLEKALSYGEMKRDREQRWAWLNTPYTGQQALVIQKALSRREFHFTRQHNYRTAVKQLEGY